MGVGWSPPPVEYACHYHWGSSSQIWFTQIFDITNHINIGSLYPHYFSILDGQNPRTYGFGRCQIAKELILRSFHFFTRHAHVLRESLEVDAVQLWHQRNDVTFWKIQREGKNVQQFAGGCQTPRVINLSNLMYIIIIIIDPSSWILAMHQTHELVHEYPTWVLAKFNPHLEIVFATNLWLITCKRTRFRLVDTPTFVSLFPQ